MIAPERSFIRFKLIGGRSRFLLLFAALCISPLFTRAQNAGDLFFGAATVHEIRLTFHQNQYWDSLTAGYTNDVYIKADVEIDGSMLANSGAKFKGNSSYNNPSNKKSFKLDFNEFIPGQKYNGLKKLNLNNCFKDPTFLREKLMLDFLGHRGVPAPRCTYAELYINNVRWGLYTVVEEIDKTFLKRVFNDDKGNNFKGDPSGDLKWLGPAASNYYPKYELKTNETQNNWNDLILFINKLNMTSTAVLPDTLANYFNLEEYYTTWASHILFSNLDSYLGSGHNFYLYHDSLSNKFRFITWDVNEAFGNFNMGMNVSQIESLSIFFTPNPAGNRPLHERLLQNNSVKQRMADELCAMVNFDFSIWTLEHKIDSLVTVIRPYVYADNLKFFSNQNFEDNIDQTITVSGVPGGNTLPGIKSFLINRRNSVATQLATWSCTVGVEDTNPTELTAFPNPGNGMLQIHGPQGSNWDYSVYDLNGKKMSGGQLLLPGRIDTESWDSNGLFLIRFNNQQTNSSYVVKFLKL